MSELNVTRYLAREDPAIYPVPSSKFAQSKNAQERIIYQKDQQTLQELESKFGNDVAFIILDYIYDHVFARHFNNYREFLHINHGEQVLLEGWYFQGITGYTWAPWASYADTWIFDLDAGKIPHGKVLQLRNHSGNFLERHITLRASDEVCTETLKRKRNEYQGSQKRIKIC